MNTILANNIHEMTTILGQASYDIEWGYRSALDAATDILADPRFANLGLNHAEVIEMIRNAADQGREATEQAVTAKIQAVYGF